MGDPQLPRVDADGEEARLHGERPRARRGLAVERWSGAKQPLRGAAAPATGEGDAEREDLWQRSAEDAFETPSQMVARHDEQRLLLRALRSIPLELQIAIELFYWEEMPLADIANVLEIPAGTVKSRLHRAKQLLREKVLELAASPELARTTMDDFERWAKSLRNPEE